ncbi:MAG TPA: Ig-like domain-containing protein [Longimicrobium sp.]
MASKAHFAAAALAVLAAACDGGGGGPGPVTPVETPLRLEVVAGDAQGGIAGETLTGPLVVRVTRGGQPVGGSVVTFTASAGTVDPATRTTDFEGRADVRWTLPIEEAALAGARVTARLGSGAAADSVVFTARRPRPDEMDLVTAPAGLSVRLLAYDAGAFMANGTARYTFTDSVQVRFRDATLFDEFAAFAPGRAPLLVAPAWSTGRDTVRLAFSSTVIRIPMTIWVVQPPFDSTAKLVSIHLQRVAEVWEPQGLIGLRDVRIVDATGFSEAARFQGENLTPCNAAEKELIGWDEGRINAYYIGQTRFENILGSGTYCGEGWIEIPPLAWERPPFTTLAHEIGHGFLGGWHETSPENLMYFRGGAGKLNEGQLFRAHYSDSSLLNTMFSAHPGPMRRPCSRVPDASAPVCPPTSMVLD